MCPVNAEKCLSPGSDALVPIQSDFGDVYIEDASYEFDDNSTSLDKFSMQDRNELSDFRLRSDCEMQSTQPIHIGFVGSISLKNPGICDCFLVQITDHTTFVEDFNSRNCQVDDQSDFDELSH